MNGTAESCPQPGNPTLTTRKGGKTLSIWTSLVGGGPNAQSGWAERPVRVLVSSEHPRCQWAHRVCAARSPPLPPQWTETFNYFTGRQSLGILAKGRTHRLCPQRAGDAPVGRAQALPVLHLHLCQFPASCPRTRCPRDAETVLRP